MVSTDERQAVEQTATELLKAQVFAAYQSRKFTAIWELFEMQIALNTDCEIDNAALRSTSYFECISKDEGFAAQQALEFCNGEMETCLAQVQSLAAINAALVEFVKAEDAWNAHAESGDWDEDDTLYHAMIAARQRLATDHGIPLPGEGVGS